MEKLPNWIDRLARLIRDRKHTPFEWGKHDCCLWAADAVEAQTGIDQAPNWRGSYSTPIGAVRLLTREGVRSPTELATRLWGPKQHISRAKIGDIVVGHLGDRFKDALGVCYGRNSLFVGTDAGHPGLVTLQTLNLEHCYTPWAASSKE